MSSGPGEPLIGSCQPSRRPIDDYIEYYEEYQAHTDASKKYLSCYLLAALVVVLAFHVWKIVLQLGYTPSEWTYYLPFVLWFEVTAMFKASFSVTDPHILNQRKQITICSCPVDLFSFYLMAYGFILAFFLAFHAFLGVKGKYLIPIDLLTCLLNLRVIQQVRSLEERLKNTVTCFRNNKTYILNQYTYTEQKEPFEEDAPEKNERKSMNHEKVNQFLNLLPIRAQKTMKTMRSESRNSEGDEHIVYSH